MEFNENLFYQAGCGSILITLKSTNMFNQIYNNPAVLLDSNLMVLPALAWGAGGLLLLVIIISVGNFINRIIQKRKRVPGQNKLLKDIIQRYEKYLLKSLNSRAEYL